MKNTVLSSHQVTIDRTFKNPGSITDVAKEFIRMKLFPRFEKELNEIAASGLHHDIQIRLNDTDDVEPLVDIGKALQFLDERNFSEHSQVGGNPGIIALRGYYLGLGNSDNSLPIVKYAGLYPKTLDEFISKHKDQTYKSILETVFDSATCFMTDAHPQTIALESKYKIIIAYGPGRRLDDMAPDGKFSKFLKRLEKGINSEGQILFSLGVPHPLNLGTKFIDAIRRHFGERALISVGCSSFRKGDSPNMKLTKDTYEYILKKADIISMNEVELNDLHTVVVGHEVFRDIPLAYKLRELPTPALKVCHCASGSILDPGPDPERIIKNKSFSADPAKFLEETLRLSTDGATYAIDSIFGHNATEAGVRAYSSTVMERSVERFKATFLDVLERMPSGLVSVYAPMVGRPLSALTGVGARFDGLFASFLMRS